MLAENRETDDSPAIHPATHSPNPYRQLARRRFSEPLLLLLIFVFGVWLWDSHFGGTAPPDDPEEAWQLALRKADRDLRVSDGTCHLPGWLRPVLGIDPPDVAISHAAASLEELRRILQRAEPHAHGRPQAGEPASERAMRDEGAYALGVLIALREDGNPAAFAFPQLGLPGPPPPEEILTRVIRGEEYWWDLPYLRALGLEEAEFAAQGIEARSQHLTTNAIRARGAVAALAFGGLLFVPGTLTAFLRAGRPPRRPVNYAHRWTLNYGIGVFVLCTLAFLGFHLTFNYALQQVARPSADGSLLPMPLFIALDGLTRFIPAFIALAFLFRRCRHAVSRLGLAGPLDGRMVLGCFAILQVIDFGLRTILDRSGPPDPLGGLSSAEDGAWGLVFGVVSACLAAPLAEEIVFRGVLFRSLANRLRLPLAVGVSSFVFALVHFYPLTGLIAVGAVGVVCALSYAASRTLLTAVVLHALYNAAIKIPEWIIYHAPLT